MIRAQRQRVIVEGSAQGARAERVAGRAERADRSARVGRCEWVGAQRCPGIKAVAVIIVTVRAELLLRESSVHALGNSRRVPVLSFFLLLLCWFEPRIHSSAATTFGIRATPRTSLLTAKRQAAPRRAPAGQELAAAAALNDHALPLRSDHALT